MKLKLNRIFSDIVNTMRPGSHGAPSGANKAASSAGSSRSEAAEYESESSSREALNTSVAADSTSCVPIPVVNTDTADDDRGFSEVSEQSKQFLGTLVRNL